MAIGVVKAGKRNRSAHFAWGIFLLFFLIVLMGLQVATQYFAYEVGYQSALGDPWVALPGGHALYYPWSFFPWSFRWALREDVIGHYVLVMQLIVVASVAVALIIGYVFFYKRSMKKETVENLHGSARFATEEDVEAMKLVTVGKKEARGVYLSAFDFDDGQRFMRYDDSAHILGAAPTRSGKGVGLVLPTMLTYPDSIFNNDIKGENYELSSGFRHRAGSLCMRFEPTQVYDRSIDGKTIGLNTVRWNPCEEVRVWTERDVMDAQNLAAAIADPDAKGMEDHWVSTSYGLLTGVILHVMYYERKDGRSGSLAGVAQYLSDPSFTDPEQMYLRMMQVEHDPEGIMGWIDSSGNPTKTHPVVAKAAREQLNREEKERNSVLSTAVTKLNLFMDPIVARNTSVSDFLIRDLMNHDRPATLYLVVPPSDKERLRPLLRLFITMLIQRSTEKMGFVDGASAKDYLHRLLLLVDELPSLRKLDILQDGLGYIAGYGLTAYLIIQDLPQLLEYYGDKQTIISGCHVRVAYAPNNLDTAEMLSKMTGTTTVEKQTVSFSGSRMSSMLNQMSVSIDQVQRPLMTADEIMQMPSDDSLVFITGKPTIKGKKIRYYDIPEFKRRASMPAPSRIGLSWEAGGLRRHNWLMLSVEVKDGRLDAYIVPYSEYPAVSPVIKQMVLATGEIIEVPCRLQPEAGGEWTGVLDGSKTKFTLVMPNQGKLDIREAFEVHLPAQDESLPKLEQTGYFHSMSIYEREARDLAREHFFNEHDTKVTFDPVRRDIVCRGEAILETEHCVILQRNSDSVSIHRKELLNRVPKIGEKGMIKYKNYRGTVEMA
jgi:type IV secretion system protein VirD4